MYLSIPDTSVTSEMKIVYFHLNLHLHPLHILNLHWTLLGSKSSF